MKPTTEQIVNARGKCPVCSEPPFGEDRLCHRDNCSHCNGTGNATFETSEVVEVPEGYTFDHIHEYVTPETKDKPRCKEYYARFVNENAISKWWQCRITYPIGHVETWPCEECDGTGLVLGETIGKIPHTMYSCPTCKGKGTLSAEVVGVRVETKTRPVTSVVFGKMMRIIYVWRKVV